MRRPLFVALVGTVLVLYGVMALPQSRDDTTTRPYDWPSSSIELPEGERIRFRDTPFECRYELRQDNAWLTVYYEGRVIADKDFWRLRQFSLLDTQTVWPVFQAWGERADDQNTRLMIAPIFTTNGVFERYTWTYVERYTLDRSLARDSKAFGITNAAGKKRIVFYAGLEEFSSRAEADQTLADARRKVVFKPNESK